MNCLIILFLQIYFINACQVCNFQQSNNELNNQQIQYLHIGPDKIVINNKIKIKFFDAANSSLCLVDFQNLTSNKTLNKITYFVHRSSPEFLKFKAKWGYLIVYHGIGNEFCDLNNYLQLTLLSDDKKIFLITNFFKSVWNYNFFINIGKNIFETNHSYLIESSNIDLKGKWVFFVDEINYSRKNQNCIFLTIILLFLSIVFNKF